MKFRTSLLPSLLLGVLLLGSFAPSSLAQTNWQARFQVTTTDSDGRFYPKHVLAIWVTDGANTFVKTLKKQADRREQYLYQWNASSGGNVVDGVTGATMPTHQTHHVTWDCRNALGAAVPDGAYRIHVEFTDEHAQGPYISDHVQFVKGDSPLTNSYPSLPNFSDLQLVFVPETETNLWVVSGATWKYNDTGTDLHGTNWSSPAYDDTQWLSGRTRLGYGGDNATLPELSWGLDPDHKYPCYYFRHRFNADHVPLSATMTVAMDDGVVVYLNGSEVARTNMAPGATAYGDWASGSVSGANEQQWHSFTLDPTLLAAGENVLAAELHQRSGTSSDIGFNLELKASAPAQVPIHIGIRPAQEGVALEWDDGILQVSPLRIPPVWQDLPDATSPYIPPPDQDAAMYRGR